MIPYTTQQDKADIVKRRIMRSTGLPASCFAPFPTSVVEVDFAPISPANHSNAYVKAAEAIVKDAAPVPAKLPAFRIEYSCSITGSWIHFPSDETTQASTAGSLVDRCRALAMEQVGVKFRIIRPEGTRAVHRIAARLVKGSKSKLETYNWTSPKDSAK